MTNLAKEEKFLSISAEQNDKVEITPVGNQSHKLQLPCGCYQIQHGFCGGNNNMYGKKYTEEAQSKRSTFLTFCNTHK